MKEGSLAGKGLLEGFILKLPLNSTFYDIKKMLNVCNLEKRAGSNCDFRAEVTENWIAVDSI